MAWYSNPSCMVVDSSVTVEFINNLETLDVNLSFDESLGPILRNRWVGRLCNKLDKS